MRYVMHALGLLIATAAAYLVGFTNGQAQTFETPCREDEVAMWSLDRSRFDLCYPADDIRFRRLVSLSD